MTEVPSICRTLYRPSLPVEFLSLENSAQYDLFDVEGPVHIDILIGLDYYWSLMTPTYVRLTEFMVLTQTVFGWILSGSGETDCVRSSLLTQQTQVMFSSCFLQGSPGLEVSQLWELESVGVC